MKLQGKYQLSAGLSISNLGEPEANFGNAAPRFGAEGNLTDQQAKTFIRRLLRSLVAWTGPIREK